jgi:hypothetical protein
MLLPVPVTYTHITMDDCGTKTERRYMLVKVLLLFLKYVEFAGNINNALQTPTYNEFSAGVLSQLLRKWCGVHSTLQEHTSMRVGFTVVLLACW